jgi:hypothetical protein
MAGETLNLAALAGRVARLEKQNRRLRTVSLVGLLAAGALVMMGQAVPEGRTIEASDFVVEDAGGKKVAELKAHGIGGAMLDFLDANGNARLSLIAGETGTSLVFLDAKRNARFSVTDEELGLSDGQGNEIYLNPKPSSAVIGARVFRGLDFARSGAMPSQSAQVAIMDAAGLSLVGGMWSASELSERASIRADPDGSALRLLDQQGKVIWRAP